MSPKPRTSYGKFRRRVIPSLRLHQASFDRDMQDLAIRAKALRGDGPYASRALAMVAQGEQFPVRYIGKRMAECVEGDVSPELVREFGGIVMRHADRLLFASFGGDDSDLIDTFGGVLLDVDDWRMAA